MSIVCRWLPILVLAASAAVAGDPVVLNAAEAMRLGIETVPARSADRIAIADLPGLVRVPNDRLRIVAAPAEGVLTQLPVAEGQVLAAGDALATLAGPAVTGLEADFREAADDLALAQAGLDRIRGLVEDGVMAGKMQARAEAEVRQAAGHLEAKRAALVVAGADPARLDALRDGAAPAATLTLRAREAGTVLRQLAYPGERLALAAPILEIGRLDKLWIEVHVPFDRAHGFAPGARALVDGLAGVQLVGRVIALGRRVHEADRGLLVRVAVDDPDESLIPGQPVSVTLERAAPAAAVRIPRRALLQLDGHPSVFVERQGNYVPETLEVVAEHGGELVVTGNLDSGAAIVVRGTAALKALVDAADDDV